MASPENTIAFIGLGVMGFPMCLNLRKSLDKDQELVICDTNHEALERFQQQTRDEGPVRVVENGRQAVQAANVIISMLPSAAAMLSVYLDPETGILSGIDNTHDKLLIECGTIGTATIAHVGSMTQSHTSSPRITLVDAPVSGGPQGAAAATLSVMIGSPDPSFDRVRSILKPMSNPRAIHHCGPLGSGTAFKTINNYLSLVAVLSTSEALNMGARLGLDVRKLVDVIDVSSGQNWVLSRNNPVPQITPGGAASRGYAGGFRIELAVKDLGLALEMAKGVGADVGLGEVARRRFEEVAALEECKGLDCRVVYRCLSEQGKAGS